MFHIYTQPSTSRPGSFLQYQCNQCNTTEHHFIGEASLLFAFLNQLDLILLRPDLLKAPSRTSAFPSFLKKIPWTPKFRNIHEKHPIEKHEIPNASIPPPGDINTDVNVVLWKRAVPDFRKELHSINVKILAFVFCHVYHIRYQALSKRNNNKQSLVQECAPRPAGKWAAPQKKDLALPHLKIDWVGEPDQPRLALPHENWKTCEAERVDINPLKFGIQLTFM